ncbi:MAG: carbon-nitrogen hydrolase family protein [Desulfobulbaceae bacterium]|nr:carbon-nitrogen hydrolase family protein [Desulfobulbaceae bacterium]
MIPELTIALAQTKVSQIPDENLQTARGFLQQAAMQGADLVAFPEMFMACPREGVPLAAVAESLDGPFVTALTSMAAEYDLAVICGMWQKVPGEENRAANIVIALSPEGNLLAHYNKVHLFDALSVRESDLMLGGNQPPPIFSLKGVQLGLAICYDLRFPELFRDLALRGAEAVIVPSAWYSGAMKEEHWLTLLRARSIENTIYVAGANLCGGPFSARSAIFDPYGVMLAGAGEGESQITAKISRARIKEVRKKLPCLNHVNNDLFRS